MKFVDPYESASSNDQDVSDDEDRQTKAMAMFEMCNQKDNQVNIQKVFYFNQDQKSFVNKDSEEAVKLEED